MRLSRVNSSRVARRVLDHRQLTTVELVEHAAKAGLHIANFTRLLSQILVKFRDSTTQYVEMVDVEVREITSVVLSHEKGPCVL